MIYADTRAVGESLIIDTEAMTATKGGVKHAVLEQWNSARS